MLRRWLDGSSPRHGRPLHVRIVAPAAHARAAAPVVEHITDVLIDNAYRHGQGAVTVTVRTAAGGAAIDVADCGPGLRGDPETAFARRASSGNGHGFGLSLARSLAQAEHGRLIVTDPGPHPVFTLLLPRPVDAPAGEDRSRVQPVG
jgi:signal transduction histidine kinase